MSSSLSLPKHVDHRRQATAITSLVSLLPLWLVSLAITWLLAQHLTLNYWQMAADLGYVRCLPDAAGCPPLAGRGMVWWRLVFM